jgi:CDP-glycerol glycerophosphotransferase (TagB/SpsB family)
MKVNQKNPKHWFLLLQQFVYCIIALCARSLRRTRSRPLIILYGHQYSGNLRALYAEWSLQCSQEFDFYFLSLDPDLAKKLGKAGINVLRCDKLSDMLSISQATAVISDHGLHMMTPLLRFTDILFIDVWHGIPFKGFTPQDFRLQRRYDEVWVSSPLLKAVYQDKFGFPPEIVHSLGYARTDSLFLQQTVDDGFRKLADISETQRIVLYAPTWQQDDSGREMFPFGVDRDAFIQTLGEVCGDQGAILVIRSHLNARISGGSIKHVRYCSMKDFPDTESLLQQSDVLICDWSSIAFDFLALNRPTIFLEVEPPFRNGFSLGPEYRFGSIAVDMHSLACQLETALKSPESYFDEHAAAHQAITEKVYGSNTDGKSARRQLDRLSSLLARQVKLHQ